MTEHALLNYFLNKLSSDELAKDLKDSQRKTGHDTTGVHITALESEEKFIVTKEHLVRLCDDTLNGKFTPDDLNTIAFAIITSDFFTLDNEPDNAEIIETVIHDWDHPEIGFDLSLKNIGLWKAYLQTGEYKLDKKELKEKFRNDRKRRK